MNVTDVWANEYKFILNSFSKYKEGYISLYITTYLHRYLILEDLNNTTTILYSHKYLQMYKDANKKLVRWMLTEISYILLIILCMYTYVRAGITTFSYAHSGFAFKD